MNWSLKYILCLSVLVQLLNRVQLFVTPWTAARQASLSITNSRSLLKLMSILSMMPSNYLSLCPPFLLLPSIFPSIRIFPNESFLRIRWPKYWSFSFSISPSTEYSGLISFRLDWLPSGRFPLGWRKPYKPQFQFRHIIAQELAVGPHCLFYLKIQVPPPWLYPTSSAQPLTRMHPLPSWISS